MYRKLIYLSFLVLFSLQVQAQESRSIQALETARLDSFLNLYERYSGFTEDFRNISPQYLDRFRALHHRDIGYKGFPFEKGTDNTLEQYISTISEQFPSGLTISFQERFYEKDIQHCLGTNKDNFEAFSLASVYRKVRGFAKEENIVMQVDTLYFLLGASDYFKSISLVSLFKDYDEGVAALQTACLGTSVIAATSPDELMPEPEKSTKDTVTASFFQLDASMGINFSQITKSPKTLENLSIESLPTGQLEICGIYYFNRKLGLGGGVNWTQNIFHLNTTGEQTFNFIGTMDEDGDIMTRKEVYDDFKESYKITQIGIPVFLQYQSNTQPKQVFLLGKVGINLGFIAGSKYSREGIATTSNIYKSKAEQLVKGGEIQTETADVGSYELTAIIGEEVFNNHFDLYSERDISDDTPKSSTISGFLPHFFGGIGVGYNFSEEFGIYLKSSYTVGLSKLLPKEDTRLTSLDKFNDFGRLIELDKRKINAYGVHVGFIYRKK